MSTNRRNRRRLILPVGLSLAAVAGVTALTSAALFTDSATVSDNTFTAGTIDLSATPDSTAITMTNMAPGDKVTAPLTIKNTGSLGFRYAMESVATGNLATGLTLQVKTDVTDCTNTGFAATGTNLYNPAAPLGTTAGMKVFGDKAQGPDIGDRTLAADANETLCIQVALPGASTGNEYQDQTASAQFNFYAEQVDNNGLVLAPPAGSAQTLLMAGLNGDGTAVNLNWPASTDQHVTGYVLSRTTNNGTTWETIATLNDAKTKTYTDTTVTEGTSYGYAIQAVGFDGTLSRLPSRPSPSSIVTVPYQAPAAPTDITVTPAVNSVTVDWTASPSATVTGYKVLRSANNGATWTPITTTDAAARTYTDTTGISGTDYLYAVIALGMGDTASPTPTGPGTGTAGPVTPKPDVVAPTGLKATAAGEAVVLSWDKPTAATTNVLVYKSNDGGGTWTQAASVPAATTTYTDYTPKAGLLYSLASTNGTSTSAKTSPVAAPASSVTTMLTWAGSDANPVMGSDGNIYTISYESKSGPYSLKKTTPAGDTTAVTTFDSGTTTLNGNSYGYWGGRFAQGTTGNFYLSGNGAGESLFSLTPTGTIAALKTPLVPNATWGSTGPQDIVVVGSNIYVVTYSATDSGVRQLMRVTTSGTATTLATLPRWAIGITYGSDGYLYLTTNDGYVLKYTTSGGLASTIRLSSGQSLNRVTLGADGYLYGFNYSTGDIERVAVSGTTGTVTKVLHVQAGAAAGDIGGLSQSSDKKTLYFTTKSGLYKLAL